MAKKKTHAKKSVKARTGKSKLGSSNGSDQQMILAFPAKITPVSLEFHPALEYREWSPVGVQLRRVKEWLQFAIGDWLNHGEQNYGEMYSQAASDTGLPEETLMILKYVSSRVSPDIRNKNLAWSHHREVAKFPPEEQSRWLEMAGKKSWSVRELRDALNKKSGKKDKGKDRQEAPTGEACQSCGKSPAPMQVCGGCLATLAEAPPPKKAA